MTHGDDRVWVGAVFSERSVGNLRERPESVGEQQPLKAMVSISGKFEQLVTRVPAAGEGSIDVKEVTGQGPAEESAYFIGNGVVGMEDRPNVSVLMTIAALNPEASRAEMTAVASSGNSSRCCQLVNKSTSPLGRSPIPWAETAYPPARASP